MQEVAGGAAALSTYGLYAIVSFLTVAVVFLFKSLRALETKFRDYISTTSLELQEKTTAALIDSTTALKASTEAITRLASIMEYKDGRHK